MFHLLASWSAQLSIAKMPADNDKRQNHNIFILEKVHAFL
jgi:hypothetical protein